MIRAMDSYETKAQLIIEMRNLDNTEAAEHLLLLGEVMDTMVQFGMDP